MDKHGVSTPNSEQRISTRPLDADQQGAGANPKAWRRQPTLAQGEPAG